MLKHALEYGESNPATDVFLSWLAERLIYQYKESPILDFVQALQRKADKIKFAFERLNPK